ncbi:acetyltransferase [Frigoribacterium sp. Leaf164]|uniref:GNAT family N-acetyltransferase n=1 Tax=Frigoribacterium sp. Leaf164 TaxID=1736282 RepID=UPI0006FA8388|nr:GNAT family protein [Frigoribacterium sp. Leaf164]KQR45673.1 acetyltransferase [Frigoribacterium sp. Leaf164]
MTGTRPPLVPLVGRHVVVEPITPDDLAELHPAIARPEVFAGGWGGGSAAFRADLEGWSAFMRGYLLWGTGNVYGVRLVTDGAPGALVGTTTLAEFQLENESAHLGWTAYAPETWGTAVNVETKLLVLGTAFEHGLGRVQIQADAANARSRAAIVKLGATPEGVLRRTQPRADGTWRDTAVYSVLADEWPRVQEGLTARLAAHQQPSRL